MSKLVEDYMSPIPNLLVETDTRLSEAIIQMQHTQSNLVIVVDKRGFLRGIITGTDIIREIGVSIESSMLNEGLAIDIMTKQVKALSSDLFMLDAVKDFFRDILHIMIVTRADKPIGIITQKDIIKWWSDEYLKA